MCRPDTCRTAVEMSSLSAVEMSSYGPCSVRGLRTWSGRGADGVEPEGEGPRVGAAAGERRSPGGSGRGGAARGDAAPPPASGARVRGGGRRGGGARSEGAAVEPVAARAGAGVRAVAGGRSAVCGLRPDAAGRAPRAALRGGGEPGHAETVDAGGRAVGASPATREAPQPAAAAGGAGRTGAVGQLRAPVAGGEVAGRPGVDLDPRRRDEPSAHGPLRGARQRGGEPAGDHRVSRAPRPARGGLHRPRRALRAVALEEGGSAPARSSPARWARWASR